MLSAEKTPGNVVKFNLYNVTHIVTKAKCRVYYSLDNRADGRKCITLFSKCILESLKPIFGDIVQNNTDSMSDYFEKDRVTIFEDHPCYPRWRAQVEAIKAKLSAKRSK